MSRAGYEHDTCIIGGGLEILHGTRLYCRLALKAKVMRMKGATQTLEITTSSWALSQLWL